jgi:hypothetical protein
MKRTNPRGAKATPTLKTPKQPPTTEEIRHRAYKIFLSRCGAAGTALDDWLLAERELTKERSSETKHQTQ